jgi:hypothetical protein
MCILYFHHKGEMVICHVGKIGLWAEPTLEGTRYLCRTELPGNAYEAFRALRIRPPSQVVVIAQE